MNDRGVYGFGQLATILRASLCEPKIESVTKTDGLTFRVREILEATFKGKSFPGRNAAGLGAPRDARIAVATDGAAATVSAARDRAMDNTPTQPGSEAAMASSGTNETRDTEKEK
jgi:hypothetical protein